MSCTFYLKEDEMKIAMFAHFKENHGNHKKFKSLYDFGGCCLKLRDVCMDFEPHFKVHNLVSVHPKSIILGQMTNLNMIFHVVASVCRLVKIWNSPQFPDGFGTANYKHWCGSSLSIASLDTLSSILNCLVVSKDYSPYA